MNSLDSSTNETVWDRKRRGHYEVYYLKWNHLKTRTAVWLRYTLHVPVAGGGEPTVSLWGIFFDAKDPSKNQALKSTSVIQDWISKKNPFSFWIDTAVLTDRSAKGRIEENGKFFEWDLQWDPNPDTICYLPYAWLYKAPLPKTKVLTPNIDIRFHGTFRTQDQTFVCEGEPGEQTHIWGVKHAQRWVWGHCNTFKEDPSAVFWGLSAQIPIGSWITPPLSVFYFRYRGGEYLVNRLWKGWSHPTDFSLGHWDFTAIVSKDLRLKGEFRTTSDRCVGVEYRDPDGDPLYCNNTKIADFRLTVLRRKGGQFLPETSLHAEGTSAWELVERNSYPQVPIQI
ncbi:MAG: hypothetical protein HY538_00350 [Deltaproteobacteria bacterium]|nr:hypothetical protein [Deltaproteobacteria bacterium]